MAGIKTEETIHKLKNEEPIIFGTDTINGIGCLYSSKKAADKIFKIKGRDPLKPLILLCSSIEMVERFFEFDKCSRDLALKYLPGALTIIARPKVKLNSYLLYEGYASFRIPARESLIKIIEAIGEPLASTSLNISKESVMTDRNKVNEVFNGIYICNSLSSKTIPSTVVKCVLGKAEIIRKGIVKI